MNTIYSKRAILTGRGPRLATISILVLSLITIQAIAQDKPVYKNYRGVAIGMSAEEARSKLGKAKESTDGEDYFEFSGDESARVIYDENKYVRAISITFEGKLTGAPKSKDVLGSEIEARPDGGMYKMLQYPSEGFWVSYVKTAGDSPMVIITLQKMG
ncbi:MAG: hypothetical protein H0V76_02430 [Blastocatellia bacterium]|nr:hypothetical protein [Blastocatellia bacterium]